LCDAIQKWKGLFRGPLVLQTFAAHLVAIEGSQKISGLHIPELPFQGPIGALGLAAAAVSGVDCACEIALTAGQVERALTLIATGTLTVEIARAGRGKAIPKTPNLSTGKDSTRQTGFSDGTWGDATRGYARSARKLVKAKCDVVMKDAQGFVKTKARNKSMTEGMEVINVDEDQRACLVYISESDSASD
jgi:hypothetical protein